MLLFDLISDLVEAAEELETILAESAAEFGELATDGFKEMVVEGKSDYKTSYEIRDEAKRIIISAESELSEKVEFVKEQFTKAELIYQHLHKKEQRLLRMRTDTSQYAHMPRRADLQVFSGCYRPCFDQGFFDFGTFLGIAGNALRKQEAQAYLESAKSYRTKARRKGAEYDRVLAKLTAVVYCMEEENRILDVIEGASRHSGRFTDEWVVSTLKRLVEIPVCDSKGVLSDTYHKAIQNLKKEVSE